MKRPTKALTKASRFIRDNREEAAKVLMEWGKAKPEHAYASYDATVKVISLDGGIPEDGLKLLIDQAKRDAKITREVALGEIADFGICEKFRRRLDCGRGRFETCPYKVDIINQFAQPFCETAT